MAETGLAQRIAARVRARGGGRLHVQARRGTAHVARQVGADLFDRSPLGAGDDVAVHRFDRAEDLVDFERAAERRRVGHPPGSDEVLDEGRGPVAEGEVGRRFLGEQTRGQEQEQKSGAHGGGNIVYPPMHVENHRGSVVESRHAVHVAVVDSNGRLVAQAGDPAYTTFWRSAAKPFQAQPLVEDGVVERFGLQRQDLALACASHSSEPAHVALVREFLQRIGCSERDLMCGPHRPLSDAVAKDYETRGVRLTAVYSNCSGKHTGMLALAKHHGWPTEFYARVEHPVQQRCLKSVSEYTDVAVQDIGVAVDGCGVACFALPLRNMALAYTRIPAAILEAMVLHPELIAGEGRPCTEMMRAHPGRVVAKVGAEGVYSASLIREGLGVTLKVEDGHSVASALAIASVLAELGLKPQPAALLKKPITNSRGETVGEMRVNGGLLK